MAGPAMIAQAIAPLASGFLMNSFGSNVQLGMVVTLAICNVILVISLHAPVFPAGTSPT